MSIWVIKWSIAKQRNVNANGWFQRSFTWYYGHVLAQFEAWSAATVLFLWEENGGGLIFLIWSTSWEIELKFYSKVEKNIDSREASHGDYGHDRALFEAWSAATTSFHREEHGDDLRFLIRSSSWEIESKFYLKVNKKGDLGWFESKEK